LSIRHTAANKPESLPGEACTVCGSLPLAKQLHQQCMTKYDKLLVQWSV
jgi:hypothetical protein